jgi:hypothetical protein
VDDAMELFELGLGRAPLLIADLDRTPLTDAGILRRWQEEAPGSRILWVGGDDATAAAFEDAGVRAGRTPWPLDLEVLERVVEGSSLAEGRPSARDRTEVAETSDADALEPPRGDADGAPDLSGLHERELHEIESILGNGGPRRAADREEPGTEHGPASTPIAGSDLPEASPLLEGGLGPAPGDTRTGDTRTGDTRTGDTRSTDDPRGPAATPRSAFLRTPPAETERPIPVPRSTLVGGNTGESEPEVEHELDAALLTEPLLSDEEIEAFFGDAEDFVIPAMEPPGRERAGVGSSSGPATAPLPPDSPVVHEPAAPAEPLPDRPSRLQPPGEEGPQDRDRHPDTDEPPAVSDDPGPGEPPAGDERSGGAPLMEGPADPATTGAAAATAPAAPPSAAAAPSAIAPGAAPDRSLPSPAPEDPTRSVDAAAAAARRPAWLKDQIADLADIVQALDLSARATHAHLGLERELYQLRQFTRTIGLVAAPPPRGQQEFDLVVLVEEQLGALAGREPDAPRILFKASVDEPVIEADKLLVTMALEALLLTAMGCAGPGDVVRVSLDQPAEGGPVVHVRFPAGPMADLDPAEVLQPYALKGRLSGIGSNALAAAGAIAVGQGGDLVLRADGDGHRVFDVSFSDAPRG